MQAGSHALFLDLNANAISVMNSLIKPEAIARFEQRHKLTRLGGKSALAIRLDSIGATSFFRLGRQEFFICGNLIKQPLTLAVQFLNRLTLLGNLLPYECKFRAHDSSYATGRPHLQWAF